MLGAGRERPVSGVQGTTRRGSGVIVHRPQADAVLGGDRNRTIDRVSFGVRHHQRPEGLLQGIFMLPLRLERLEGYVLHDDRRAERALEDAGGIVLRNRLGAANLEHGMPARIRLCDCDGRELGVDSTPTIFVNGTEIEDWHDFNAVSQAIEAALAG